MCGIVGYIGTQLVVPRLLNGLKHVEYRGYDSAGLAVIGAGELHVVKQAGKIANLVAAIGSQTFDATRGIAHTRWATHGESNELNAHPHTDTGSTLAIVHNGIIENYDVLKRFLLQQGHSFRSATDTEVLAHLIEACLDGDPVAAVRSALQQVKGTYGLAVILRNFPEKILFARNGSPLCLGIGADGMFVASDPQCFREYTDQLVPVHDGQLGWVSADGYEILDAENVPVVPVVETITWQLGEIEKGVYPHFTLKEIFEQPASMQNAMRGRLEDDGTVKFGGLEAHTTLLRNLESVDCVAAGTSLHSGMFGKVALQEIAEICAHAENASELANQKRPYYRDRTAIFAISQSGTTSDLLHAMDVVQRLGLPCFGLVNVVGSEVARRSLAGVYLHAGPEIGVASTKAFTNQVVVLTLLSLYLRQLKGLPNPAWIDRLAADLRRLPSLVQQVLDRAPAIQSIAEKYAGYPNFLFLGRGVNYPTALEGALKLKEVAYVNAIGYSAGEMKHGPIALIDGGFPTMVIAPSQDDHYADVIGNIHEIRARRGRVVAIATDGDTSIANHVQDVIWIPPVDYYLSPVLSVVPLQLFAYYVSVLRGNDPDQPRNLAKSVTVK